MRLMAFAVTALLGIPALAQTETWQIDPVHSLVSFSVRHMGISNVKGEFTKVSGQLVFDEKHPAQSSVEATVDVASLDTREPKRDGHLKSPDFFDLAKYPNMTFKSKHFEKVRAGSWKVAGDLTIRDVTRAVVLDVVGPTPEVKDPGGKTRIGLSATTKLNRRDFGMVWSKALDNGGLVVGNEVTVNLDLELVKK
jgi:polyisoprenoid-binding protein YceI